ncbi:unnamed protein product, partial [Rangifer tarandus platyrhynchus]
QGTGCGRRMGQGARWRGRGWGHRIKEGGGHAERWGKTERKTGAGGGHAETQDGETAKAETAPGDQGAQAQGAREGARAGAGGEIRGPRPRISGSAAGAPPHHVTPPLRRGQKREVAKAETASER